MSLIDTSASLSAGSGQRFVMIESTTNPALAGYLVRYQHPNHQSSSTLETDDSGAVISYEEYHPYGTTSYQAMEKPVRAAAKRYRYTGMERDEETGLSYHNARYYITWLGRWLNPDPIGINDGVNVYSYCHNDPINGKDTSGTQNNKKVEPKFAFVSTLTVSKTVDASSLRAAGTSAGATIDLAQGGNGKGKGGFGWGLIHGGAIGTGATVNFVKSLTTSQGWKDVGTGLLNTAKSLNPIGEEGKQLRHQVVQGVRDYIKDLPNKSDFELGSDVGAGLEKLGEAVLLKKGLDVAKSKVPALNKTKSIENGKSPENNNSKKINTYAGSETLDIPPMKEQPIPYVRKGHMTPWAKMTNDERRAFEHSYSRHKDELGLPNWEHLKAEQLQVLFNEKVSLIRASGCNVFFQSNEWVNGVRQVVNRTEPIINGQKYFYYETLDGKFVSAGKIM